MGKVLSVHGLGSPGGTFGTSPLGAIVSGPCRVSIGTVVTGAFVVGTARSIPRTTVGTVRPGGSKNGGKHEEEFNHCHCVSS